MRARLYFLVVAGLLLVLNASSPVFAQKGDEGSPLPTEREVITAANVGQVVLLTSLPDVSSTTLAWSADGKMIAVRIMRGGEWGTGLYDTEKLQAEPRFLATGTTLALALSPDSRLIATVHGDGTASTVTLWRLEDGVEVSHAADMKVGLGSPEFNHTGSMLAVSDFYDAYVYGITDDTLTQMHVESGMRNARFAFSPDGNLLAAANGWQLILWGLHGYEPDAEVQSDGFVPSNVAFSPDGTLLAGVSSPGPQSRVAVWNLASSAQAMIDNWGLGADAHYMSSNADVSFSMDGSLVAASNGSQEAYIYDVGTRQRLATLSSDPAGLIEYLAFSPDGTLVAGVGQPESGMGRLWLWGVPKP